MATKYQVLYQQRHELRAEGQTILDAAERTPEQDARLQEITGQVEALNKQLEAEEQAREAMRAEAVKPGPAASAHRDMNDLIRQAAGRG